MYVIFIHVPFQPVSAESGLVASDWGRSLCLLRDSLNQAYGPVVVVAPHLGSTHSWGEQEPVELNAAKDGISFVPLCPHSLRARSFWWRSPVIFRRCLTWARRADVVHAGVSPLYKPISFFGFMAARVAGVPTVFVQDGDVITQAQQLSGGRGGWGLGFYCWLYERVARYGVSRADLSLIKGDVAMARYGPYAKNAKDFHDTSCSEEWAVPKEELARKLTSLASDHTLRCVCFGRLLALKGIDHAIKAVAAVAAAGVNVQLDVIGDGPARGDLESLVAALHVEHLVRFTGKRVYGRSFLEELRQYHLMLFPSLVEETPRSLFDACTAGAAIAAYGSRYVQTLLEAEKCGVCVPMGEHEQLASRILDLWLHRDRLVLLVANAAKAGPEHSAERWYARRATWTAEIGYHRAGVTRRAAKG